MNFVGLHTHLASYPVHERRGGKRPGTNCTRMCQHFRDIYCKIIHIPLVKHVVVPQKENTDEISGRQKV